MGDSINLKGVNGQIKWHYHVAAEVKGYTVARSPDTGWSLRATVAEANELRLAQRPLLFVATHNQGEWRWPIESIEVADGTVTAKLGHPLT